MVRPSENTGFHPVSAPLEVAPHWLRLALRGETVFEIGFPLLVITLTSAVLTLSAPGVNCSLLYLSKSPLTAGLDFLGCRFFFSILYALLWCLQKCCSSGPKYFTLLERSSDYTTWLGEIVYPFGAASCKDNVPLPYRSSEDK